MPANNFSTTGPGSNFNMDDLKRSMEALTGGPSSYMESNPDIICDICDKKVDKVVGAADPKARGIVVTVYCHGKTEQVVFPAVELRQLKPGMLEFGRAFRKDKGEKGAGKIVRRGEGNPGQDPEVVAARRCLPDLED